MKNLLYIFLLLNGLCVSAQDTLYISSSKFLSVHFNKNINFHQVNAIFDNSIGIKTLDNTLFIQAFDAIEDTNLIVRTVDNKYHSFLLKYKKDITVLQKFIDSEATEKTSTKELSYSNNDILAKKIFNHGFIKTRNYYEANKIAFYVKGIYYDNQKLYIYIELNNKTKIDYIIKDFKFFITNDKSISTSEQETLVKINDTISDDNDFKSLKKKKSLIFILDKFTLTDNKKLLFEMLEEQGDRNISFKILPEQINLAKQL